MKLALPSRYNAVLKVSPSHMTLSKNSEELITSIVEQIADKGYAVARDFLSPEDILAFNVHAQQLKHQGLMHQATTGQNHHVTNLRGDSIYWVEAQEASNVEQLYLDIMYELQNSLNQAFFLGLFELESHFAIYPAGSGYQKHLDQFIGQEDRKVSAILYLNQEWKSEDGGQLRIYLDKTNDHSTIDISPEAGTLVVFLSRDFLHEVLPAKRERLSITGWFRTRNITSTT